MDVARIRHVAALAELSLTPDEEQRLVGEIGRIVAYVEELSAVDTTGVPPTGQALGDEAERSGVLRDDVVVPGLSNEEALAAAPQAEHGGFSVPTFVGS